MRIDPPIAEKIDHADERHGRPVDDEYAWLRQREDPRVHEHLEAENAYTDAIMQSTAGLRERLYEEMLGRIKQTDRTVPTRLGEHYYYSRTEEGKQYRIHCRTHGPDGTEQILLDENALAEGQPFLRVGAFALSPDRKLLAYSTDTEGSETYTIFVKDLTTGELLGDRIEGTYDSVVWAADNRTVFYNTVDASHRPYRLYRHVLGQDSAVDTLVHEEADETFFLGLYKTCSKRFLVLHMQSNNTSEAHVLDAADPTGEFRLIRRRERRIEYSLEHWQDRFFVLTNDGAVNFKLVQAPVANPGTEHWTDVIPHRPGVKLEGVEVFSGHLVVSERENGLRGLRILSLPDLDDHRVELPEPVYTVYASRNPEFDTDQVRFVYESPVTPPSVYDYDMGRRTRELRKVQEVLGGFDAGKYRCERLHARAPDGTEIPISLVSRGEPRGDEPRSLLLYAYGSYGITVDPTFSSTLLSLLDRGALYAIAHVRGGGSLGRPWYDDGKLLRKRNTFADFIACAEHLVNERYTSPDRLLIRGGSAGGLLVGAVVNQRPDLFRAAVAKVPFVDVINTMFDASLPLTAIEWEEWGDPREREYYDYIASYSPYDNVSEVPYPDMLVTAGLHDPRVAYWEPAKWVARLRERTTRDGVILLRTDMGSGHGGPSGRYDSLRELAYEYAFMLDRLGIPD